MRRTGRGPIENSYGVDWRVVEGSKPVETAGFDTISTPAGQAGTIGESSSSNINEFLLSLAGNSRLVCAHINVDLRANTKFGQIDAGLDGETGSRNDPALVVRLKVIHISAGAVDLLADGVAGAMNEVITEAAILNIGSGGIIHFKTVQGLATLDSTLDTLDGAIASVTHHVENILESRGRRAATITGPRNVVVHGQRVIELGPHVHEHGVAGLNLAAAFRAGFIMRIRHVGVDGDDGP